MRIATVWLPHFPALVETSRSQDLIGQALIIGQGEQAQTVFDCSALAETAGVRVGGALREALARCPTAVYISADPTWYETEWTAVLDAFTLISPQVEDGGLGKAFLNVAGLAPHYADDLHLGETIIEATRQVSSLIASVGIAEGKFVSFAAAAVSAPGEVTAIPPGREADFLSPLDVSVLPLSRDMSDRLGLLGFETIGELARLSVGSLQAQFGKEGLRLWDLVHGLDTDALRPWSPEEVLEEASAFEAPVVSIDVLAAVGRQLLSRLEIGLRQRAARSLTIRAAFSDGRGWERRVVFREALSEADRLAFVLKSTLAASPPPGPVTRLSLRLSGLAHESGKQLTFGDKSRLQRQLEEAIRQLKARYGYSPIYRCVDAEPWSPLPEDRQILVESDA